MDSQSSTIKNYFRHKGEFTSISEAFLWIQSFYNAEKSGQYDSRIYRLDRMHSLLDFFENPHHAIPSIHIAGSKGKGSTAAFCASILCAYHLKVGLYQSPHLLDYRERITQNGIFFPDALYLKGINQIYHSLPDFFLSHPTFQAMPPTVFELLTLLAFLVFKEANCDVLVIETGLGGRLDATNCITPLLSIITRIEVEHTEYLGKTLTAIAGEKGGIIKPQIPFLLTKEYISVTWKLKAIAKQKKAPLFRASTQLRTLFHKKTIPNEWIIPLTGDIQRLNAGNAVAAATLFLPALNLPLNLEKIKKGIETTKIAGRMEKIFDNPPLWVDGAHTPLSFAEATKTFATLYPQPKTLLFCAVDGKNIPQLLKTAFRSFSTILFTSAGSFRKNDPQAIYQTALALQKRKKGYRKIQLILESNLQQALQRAIEQQQPLLTAGSFYLVAEIKALIRDHY